jgi:hypothetical protein
MIPALAFIAGMLYGVSLGMAIADRRKRRR